MSVYDIEDNAKVGVTLGKFAPFHKGHRYMIDMALAHSDHVIVFVYTCDLDVPSVSERADWIREEYSNLPKNRLTVVEAWNGPTERATDPHGEAIHEKYIVGRIRELQDGLYDRVSGFFSSEGYGSHMAAGLDCEDMRVDMDRLEYPISGTKVRNDVYENREMVPKHVYRDLVDWVLFVGAPSTGKTTISETIAEMDSTVWQEEVGRWFWEEREIDGLLTDDELLELAITHRQEEMETVQDAKERMYVDTSALATLNFSRWYYGEGYKPLVEMAKEIEERYDHIFLCMPDFEFENEVGRGSAENQKRFHKMNVEFLERYDIEYTELYGPVSERVTTVANEVR